MASSDWCPAHTEAPPTTTMQINSLNLPTTQASRARERRSRRGWPQLSWFPFALLIGTSISCAASEEPAELLVKWRDGPHSAEAAAANAAMGGSVRRNFPSIGWQWIRLPEGMSVAEGIRRYTKLDSVLLAEPNRKVPVPLPPVTAVSDDRGLALAGAELPILPDDPMFRQQWNLQRIGATNAWATTTGSTNVVVAVFDTGVDYTHPDLAPNMWRHPGETGLDGQGNDKATNGLDDDQNGYVDDLHGIDAVTGSGDPQDRGYPDGSTRVYHGTFVAGVIAAAGNNHVGIAGINWTTQIMALAVINVDGSGASPQNFLARETGVYLTAWDYVLEMKRRGTNVRVISDSVALTAHSIAIQEVIAALTTEGVLIVSAAENASVDEDILVIYGKMYNLPAQIRVTNSNQTDAIPYGSFGQSTVHLAAPGTDIISTEPGGRYRTASGTSAACPLVSGAAALLLSARPDLTLDELKAALLGSVDHPASLRGKLITGGRLNVARAMQSLSRDDLPAIIVTSLPAGPLSSPDLPLHVTFSQPMDRTSVESSFSIRPSIPGTFEWSADSRTFHFRHDPLDRTTTYVVTILGSALDQNGQGLDGNFNQETDGSPADDYRWSLRFRVSNDNFAEAQLLDGESGQTGGTTRSTIWEPEEKLQGTFYDDQGNPGSVWYRWTAPDSEAWYTFDLAGASFDSYLAICTGTAVNDLVTIASNDNYGTRRSSRVSFRAADTNYFITVIARNGSLDSTSGPFDLTWYPTPPPGFTGSQFSPTSAAPGRAITLTGTNFSGATAVLFNGVPGSFTNAAGDNHDLRITAVVPPGALPGPVTVVTPHGSAATTALVEVLPPPLALELLSNGEAQLTWGATSGLFVVDHSTDLGAWQPLENAPVVDAKRSTLIVRSTLERSGFFRLRRQPE